MGGRKLGGQFLHLGGREVVKTLVLRFRPDFDCCPAQLDSLCNDGCPLAVKPLNASRLESNWPAQRFHRIVHNLVSSVQRGIERLIV